MLPTTMRKVLRSNAFPSHVKPRYAATPTTISFCLAAFLLDLKCWSIGPGACLASSESGGNRFNGIETESATGR